MLHETLKALRKQKGYSQEEASGRLNVVRQTVSKWEKGLSVPDAAMLMKIAELYEVSVAELLGTPPDTDGTPSDVPPVSREIAEQLSRINEQLVIRNRRSRRILRIIAGIVLTYLIVWLILILSALTLRVNFTESSISHSVEAPVSETTENTFTHDTQ